ncbi:MAG: ATP-binding protein [Polyangiales bacterium]
MKRRHLWIGVFALVPTLLLAAGWLVSSLRAHSLSLRDREARLEQEIRSVRSAVDESLEELREREDEREFYLYNKYYSPPDVIALNDPVAISPLASDPSDERILGYFQVEPGGAIRTPYTRDETEHSTREDSIRRVVASDAFSQERIAAGRVPRGSHTRLEAAPTQGRPSGPLTTNLREWGNAVAEDLRLAQSGSGPAEVRVVQRGRSAPITNRYPIQSDEAQHQLPSPRRQAGPSRRNRRPIDVGPSENAGLMAPSDVTNGALVHGAIAQNAEDVGYEAMQWTYPDENIALQRLVRHEGVSVVQGVLMDLDHLKETWMPALVYRHSGEEYAPDIVDRNAEADCAVRGRLSEVLPFDLCFAPSALSGLQRGFEEELILQLGMLAGLLLIVLLAIGAVTRASNRAEELAAQKSLFVSAVSHELRTPLTTIRMHAEMLEEGLVSDKRRPQVHDELARESIRLARLVDNVLEVSRLEDGQRPMRIKHGDLCAHVRSVVEGQRRVIESKGMHVALTLPDKAEASFEEQAMEQILVNLLDNAAKYGAGDDGELEVRVDVEDARVVLRVMDRGAGIPEDLQESVFERFFRVDREEDAHAPGTGIGLALVRELARAQGGEAAIRAREGGGVEAVVTLVGSVRAKA